MSDQAPERIWAWQTGIQPPSANAGLWRSGEALDRTTEYARLDTVYTRAQVEAMVAEAWVVIVRRDIGTQPFVFTCRSEMQRFVSHPDVRGMVQEITHTPIFTADAAAAAIRAQGEAV